MEHELIDFYDKNGVYQGKIDKAIAHKNGLWHKSVHVWIINDKKEILFQKRCSEKKFFPGYWDCSFAGHIGAGEDSLTSAIREGQEELGLILNKNDLQYAFTIKEQFTWKDIISREFVDVYIMKANIDVNNLTFQKEEVASAKYFDLGKVFNPKNKNFFPHNEEYFLLKKKLFEKEK